MAFRYRLVLEDGSPADPPTFTTAVPTWHEGDKVLIRRRQPVAVAHATAK